MSPSPLHESPYRCYGCRKRWLVVAAVPAREDRCPYCGGTVIGRRGRPPFAPVRVAGVAARDALGKRAA